ncbi:hypothetical protein D3C87_1702040 [compost metagenome]
MVGITDVRFIVGLAFEEFKVGHRPEVDIGIFGIQFDPLSIRVGVRKAEIAHDRHPLHRFERLGILHQKTE